MLGGLVQVDHYRVYRRALDRLPAPAQADLKLLSLDERTLHQSIAAHADIMQVQARALERHGAEGAYGVFAGARLVHVLWLITPALDVKYPVRNVKLRSGEVEITHAVTLPEFRGRGLFTYAVGALASVAKSHGAQTLYMITGKQNVASQRAIEKAGLQSAGQILRLRLPYPRGKSLVWRGHRVLPKS